MVPASCLLNRKRTTLMSCSGEKELGGHFGPEKKKLPPPPLPTDLPPAPCPLPRLLVGKPPLRLFFLKTGPPRPPPRTPLPFPPRPRAQKNKKYPQRPPREDSRETKIGSAKTDPVQFKWGFGEVLVKDKFAFKRLIKALYLSLGPKRELLAKCPFLQAKRALFKNPFKLDRVSFFHFWQNLSKSVEKLFDIFLTIFDVYCPARKLSKSVQKLFGTFWRFLTFFDVAPFRRPLLSSVKMTGFLKMPLFIFVVFARFQALTAKFR